MQNTYNFYNLEASFKQYLLAGITKPVSIKNYLSDIRHFFGWLTLKIQSDPSLQQSVSTNFNEFQYISSILTHETIESYKSYLTENNLPVKTVNRRLSTLRKLCSFCVSQGWLKENPGKRVSNVILKGGAKRRPIGSDSIVSTSSGLQNDILHQFERHLVKENLDKPTITSSLNTIQELLHTV